MRYPRRYDIPFGARCLLFYYINGHLEPTRFDLKSSDFKQLLERRYVKVEDGKVIVLVKHPRVYKRDGKGNLIPFALDKGCIFSWK